VTLKVELVVPDRELWAGEARMVIAKTTEGDIGVLGGHAPLFGVLAEGSLVEILDPEGEAGAAPIRAAVSGGFLSVSKDQVSILAAEALFASEVDTATARQSLEAAAAERGTGEPDSADVKYAKAQLRAADDQA
jgi:F-type H+-transporting ATPase subunit epsilon